MKKMERKASTGMSTLIIFIALVLTAAVAASVLIFTTGGLQSKTLSTGKDTRNRVGTSITVVQLYGEDATDQLLTEFTEVIKLNAGSEPVKLTDLLLSLNLKNQSADYTYNSKVNCTPNNTTAGGGYGAVYPINGSGHRHGYLTSGDVIKLCFQSPRGIGEAEEMRLNLVPKSGSNSVVEVALPPLMVDKRIEFYP